MNGSHCLIISKSSNKLLNFFDSKTLNFRQNVSWAVAGNFVHALSQWGITIAIARLGGASQLGSFSLAMAIAAPIWVFLGLQLRAVQANDANRDYTFWEYLFLRLNCTCIGLTLLIIVILISGYSADTMQVIFLVGIMKSIQSVSDIIFGFAQQNERMDLVGKSIFVRGVLRISLATLSMILFPDLVWALVGMILGELIVLFFYDVRIILRVKTGNQKPDAAVPRKVQKPLNILKTFFSKNIWSLAVTALPLGFALALSSLSSTIPRYFLESFSGKTELGLFSAMAYFTVVGNIIVVGLGQASSPKMSNYIVSGSLVEFRRMFFRMIVIVLVLGIAGVIITFFAGKEILFIFYGPAFSDHGQLFSLIMTYGAVSYVYSITGFAATSAHLYWTQTPGQILVCASATIMSLVLIPQYGLLGACLANLSSVSLGAVYYGVILTYFLRTCGRARMKRIAR